MAQSPRNAGRFELISGGFRAAWHATSIEIAIADDAAVEPAREHLEVHLDEPRNPNVGLSRSASASAAIQEGACDRTPAVRDELSRDWRARHWPRPSPSPKSSRWTWAVAASPAAPLTSSTEGPPATVEVAAAETTGTEFAAEQTAGAPLTLRAAAPPMPTTPCGGTPRFRGFETAPGSPPILFRRPPLALAPPRPAD